MDTVNFGHVALFIFALLSFGVGYMWGHDNGFKAGWTKPRRKSRAKVAPPLTPDLFRERTGGSQAALRDPPGHTRLD